MSINHIKGASDTKTKPVPHFISRTKAMKKISLIAISTLIALSGAANAQAFDINTLPFSQIPAMTDNASTGSIGAPLKQRVIVRDGAKVTQFYTVDDNGAVTVVSEK